MVKTKLVEQENDSVYDYWNSRGIAVHIRPMENRANQVIENNSLNPAPWNKFSWCKRLFTQTYILADGDMVLC